MTCLARSPAFHGCKLFADHMGAHLCTCGHTWGKKGGAVKKKGKPKQSKKTPSGYGGVK